MSYYISKKGNATYLLDSRKGLAGKFIDGNFEEFCSILDIVWNKEKVGIISVISSGVEASSVIINEKSKVLNKKALDIARSLRANLIFREYLLLKGSINGIQVNGFIFIYNSEADAERVGFALGI